MLMRILPVAAVCLALGAVGCTAEVEDEGELPEVNVEGGEAPAVDVDPVDVDVSQDTQTIVTPDVDVNATEGDDP